MPAPHLSNVGVSLIICKQFLRTGEPDEVQYSAGEKSACHPVV